MGSAIRLPNLVGTVDYTAPEYHLGEPPTNRADIYALGALTYELLTGKLPYGRGFSNARDVDRLSYVSATSLRAEVPIWMDAALRKAVAVQPSLRTEALSALTEDLRRPNLALGYDRRLPLLAQNPIAVWRTIALVSLVATVLLAFWLSRK